jgi:Fe2+ transport system protein FeoA
MQVPAISTEPIDTQDSEIMCDSPQEKCIDCPELQDRECQASTEMTLSDYKPGQKGKVVQVCGNTDFRRRMMEMGFVKGTEVSVVKYAPLNDPMELVLMGYHISIRRGEAADIMMNTPDKAA